MDKLDTHTHKKNSTHQFVVLGATLALKTNITRC